MEVNKNDEKVRRALYEAYGRKTFYTNEPIDYIDMEIDHILPESLKKDKEKFQEICKEYELENFELNSLYNLVPTNKYENRTKSNKLLDKSAIIYYLQRAKEKVPEIERKIMENRDKFKYERNLSGMMEYINNQNDKQYEIERLLNYIENKDDIFNEYEEIYKFHSLDGVREKEIFKKYTKRLGIEMIIPQYDDCEVSCIIYFKTIKLRDCKFILDNKFILSSLFKGLNTDPKYGLRGFISYHKDIISELNKDEVKYFKINLGSNEIELCTEDIYSLCEVIDSVAKVYIERIKEIEKKLRVEMFPVSKVRNSYQIASITSEELIRILKFIKRHDVDNGDGKWDIFDSRQTNNIAIYTEGNRLLNDGYHSFFFIEKNEETIYYPLNSNSNYIITWRLIQDFDTRGVKHINCKETWNGIESYEWFVNELLRKVNKKMF